jgi:molecular chaperone GrpE
MSEDKEITDNTEDTKEGKNIQEPPIEEAEKAGEESIETVDIKESAEFQELNDRYLRLAAEFENYKKRTSREYSRLVETAESSLILELLQVVDDFKRALKHDDNDKVNFRQGIELIANKLEEILSRRGVREIEAMGKQFDPNFHEAIMQVEIEDKEDGIIVEEVQSGYFLNDRVLRPAKVVVAKKKRDSGAADNNETGD